jgi:hypothetical protein
LRRQSGCFTGTFTLTVRLFAIIIAMSMTVPLVGCTRQSKTGVIIANGGIGANYSDGKPAIGPTVEKESAVNADISTQTRLNINMQKGSVKITRGNQEHLQLIEKTRLQGPASKDRLNEYLRNINSDVETTSISVSINHKAYLKADVNADEKADENAYTATESKREEVKPLYRCTVDMELVVPETITAIDVNAENALVTLSGFEGMSGVDLSVERGLIRVDNCSSNKISVSVDNGDIWMENITGYCTYDCGRGDIVITGAKGAVELKSLAGETVIERVEGKLDCDISSGSLKIIKSILENGTVLYASTGTISADLNCIDEKGTYTIKSSAGDILVDLPQNTGWSLIAKSTRGRVKNNMDLIAKSLEKGPDGEVYGDVNGGGASIDLYTDRGNIILN